MHSIQARITILTITAIIISLVTFGGISLVSIGKETLNTSAEKLNLICENRKDALDEYLSSIQQSVDMVSHFTTESMDIVPLVEGGVIGADGSDNKLIKNGRTQEQIAELDTYLSRHLKDVEDSFQSVSNHTNGIVAYYYRINPQISEKQKGFFYARTGQSDFQEQKLTDLQDYDPDDTSHVVWYYQPVHSGRPVWTEPYYNSNLGVQMISYTTPIYKSGTLIGVVGMDIRYDTLVSQIEQMSIYENGFFSLLEESGNVLYHPEYHMGTPILDKIPQLNDFVPMLHEESGGDQLFHYEVDGQDRLLTFSTLKNGLKLIAIVPLSEINAVWYRLLSIIVPAAILILAGFVLATTIITKRMTEPLKRLTAASIRLADGDYSVELEYDGNDEVGILTRSFRHMRDTLQSHISDLNSKAYTDALTGIRNKGAFDQITENIEMEIRGSDSHNSPQFAIINFDCDFLKRINDNHGHEKGDLYLRTASQLICQIFAHSPVFRTGGDEFAAILQNQDFENRDELIRLFDERSAAINASTAEPWLQVYISKGMAVYSPELDADIKSVIRRADVAMYEDKKKNHSIRE